MADTTTPQAPSGATRPSASSARSGAKTPGTELQTSQGATTIADSVVTKLAGIAAREVAGIYDLGGAGARAIGNVTQRVGIDSTSQGVSVEVDGKDASVTLTVVVEYGESIPQLTQEVRDQVIRRIEGLCGLNVTVVDITVADLHFAGEDDGDRDQS